MIPEYASVEAWLFDMDGTLTIAAHDFDAIRSALDLPPGRPILEALEELEPEEQAWRHERLREMELDVARRARPADGALRLLEHLDGQSRHLGIVTRNTRENALVTLEAAGLRDFFTLHAVIGRDEAPHKPDPGGIQLLLRHFDVAPQRAVMLGDFRFDLMAATSAGVHAIYVDPTGAFPWREYADRSVRTLEALFG